MNALATDKIAQWKFDGFLSPVPFLDAEELQSCLAGVHRFRDMAGFAYQCASRYEVALDATSAHALGLRTWRTIYVFSTTCRI